MVIIINYYGQYSNRLIQNMRIRLFCKKHGIRCWNLTMGDIEKYYNISQTPKILLLLGKMIRLGLRILRKFGIDPVLHAAYPYRDEYLKEIKKYGIHLVDEWGLYDLEAERLYLDETRKLYQLKKEHYENNGMYKSLLNWKQEGYTLIGVHVRRGDYLEWRDGIYYYSDEIYEKYISQMRLRLRGKKVKFLICAIDKCEITGDDIEFSHEPWYIDHLLLGMCDYTLGPPSTFRLWANYVYAEGKTYSICSRQEELDLSRFFVQNNWREIP